MVQKIGSSHPMAVCCCCCRRRHKPPEPHEYVKFHSNTTMRIQIGRFLLSTSFALHSPGRTPPAGVLRPQDQQQSATITSAATTMPETKESLLPIVQQAIPAVDEVEIVQAIIQASAEGYKVIATAPTLAVTDGNTNDNDGTATQQKLFVKVVEAAKYGHKKWPDLRRVLLYARTEARFYNETVPLLQQKGVESIAPVCYKAHYNLSGFIDESDRAVDISNDNVPTASLVPGIGSFLVLDTMDPAQYYQKSPLTPQEACRCLRAAAKLHAAAWQDVSLLSSANDRLSRGSYNLQLRNPQEILDIPEGWQNFMNNFRDEAPELFAQESVQRLGERIVAVAKDLSTELSPSPNDACATLVHGDYKSMNVFLPTAENDGDALLIDFASTGVGIGMSDVAMHVFHALLPEDIDEDSLLASYLESFHHYRRQYRQGSDNDTGADTVESDYTFAQAKRHFRMAVLDYFRFFLGRFWKKSTVESMNKLKDNANTNLINRHVPSAMNFVKHVDEYLTEFEQEQQKQ